MIPLRYLITHLASYQVTQNGNRETIVVSDKNRCHKGQKIKNYSIIPYHDREGYETAKPDQGSGDHGRHPMAHRHSSHCHGNVFPAQSALPDGTVLMCKSLRSQSIGKLFQRLVFHLG